jgi:transcriptional regulator with XRE-family HTH domain
MPREVYFAHVERTQGFTPANDGLRHGVDREARRRLRRRRGPAGAKECAGRNFRARSCRAGGHAETDKRRQRGEEGAATRLRRGRVVRHGRDACSTHVRMSSSQPIRECAGQVSAIIVPMDKIRAGRRLLVAGSPREVSWRLAAAMKVAGLSQADIVRQLGFGSSQVSQWLSGRNRPSLDNLYLLLPFLDVDLNYLLLGEVGSLTYAKRDALLAAYDEAKGGQPAGDDQAEPYSRHSLT